MMAMCPLYYSVQDVDSTSSSTVNLRTQNQSRKGSNESGIHTFLHWVRSISAKKEVILLYASADYKVLAHNCILSLQKLNVYNVGILVLDDETVSCFKEKRIPAYNVAKITKGIPYDVQLNNTIAPNDNDLNRLKNKGWATRWNVRTTFRWPHWMLRHYLTLQVLKMGYGVYQTDVDMVFIQNPYDWLDPNADLEGQLQNWPMKKALNLGIGHISATVGGILHWETTNNLMRLTGDDPQSIENFLLIEPLIAAVGTVSSAPCNTKFPEVICTWKKSPMINYRVWAESALPMGYSSDFKYPADGNITQIPLIGIHVHVTTTDFQQGKEKLYTEFCKERRYFFIPDEYMNTNSKLADKSYFTKSLS